MSDENTTPCTCDTCDCTATENCGCQEACQCGETCSCESCACQK